MFTISIVLVLVTILHSTFEIKKAIKQSRLGLFHYVIAWYIFIYGFAPLNMYVNSDCLSLPFRNYWINLIHDWGWVMFFYLTTYVALYLGYKLTKPTPKSITLKPSAIQYNSQFNLSLLILGVGIASLLWSIKGYGGTSYYVDNISAIRSGTDDNKNYLYAFIRMFSGYILYAFILLYALSYSVNAKLIKGRLVLSFVVCCAFLSFYLLTSGGRASMITVFILVLILIIQQTGKIPYKAIFIFSIPVLFIVFYGKSYITTLFSDNQVSLQDLASSREISYWEAFMQEFCHQTMNQVTALQNGLGSRLWKDYFIWILKPVRLWSSDTFYDSISYYTTYQVLGKWESNIPPGFISLALYNGGILTLLIQSIGVGGILRKLDSLFLNSRLRSNPLIMCVYLVLFDLAWFALQNGDPALIIQTSIPFLVLVIYLFTFGKARISDQRVLHQSYFK